MSILDPVCRISRNIQAPRNSTGYNFQLLSIHIKYKNCRGDNKTQTIILAFLANFLLHFPNRIFKMGALSHTCTLIHKTHQYMTHTHKIQTIAHRAYRRLVEIELLFILFTSCLSIERRTYQRIVITAITSIHTVSITPAGRCGCLWSSVELPS